MNHLLHTVIVFKNLQPPASKKIKREKTTKAEKRMERILESFLNHQQQSEERFERKEKERRQREIELEEKRRREDQEHEVRLMGMLANVLQQRPQYTRPRQDFEEESLLFYQQQ